MRLDLGCGGTNGLQWLSYDIDWKEAV
jgi:hypothetical protein